MPKYAYRTKNLKTMIVKTNVKLNLGLSVLRKRPDGYHDIETLFVPCFDFGDTLEIITGDDYSRTSAAMFAKYGSVEYTLNDGRNGAENHKAAEPEALTTNEISACERIVESEEDSSTPYKVKTKDSGQVTVSEDSRLVQGISEDGKLMITIAREEGVDWNPLKDLCTKAYYILAQDFDLPPVKIFLEKTAPVGAGLGGGSADAAFTLKALNELCGLNLSDQRLSEYAARLGSDCSFFIFNRPMIGSGRGEVLEPYDIDLSAYETKVLIPEGVAVSTAEAYKGIVPREAAGVSDTISATRRLVSIAEPSVRCPKVAAASSTETATARGTEVRTGQCPETATVRCPETATAQSPKAETAKCLETETICGQEDRTDRSSETAAARCPETKAAKSPEAVGASSLALREVLALPVTEWKGNLVNDFEATVFKAHPELAAIKQSLYDSGAVYASMSGSGSALFALYRK